MAQAVGKVGEFEFKAVKIFKIRCFSTGFAGCGSVWVIQMLYWDNGKENGNYHLV